MASRSSLRGAACIAAIVLWSTAASNTAAAQSETPAAAEAPPPVGTAPPQVPAASAPPDPGVRGEIDALRAEVRALHEEIAAQRPALVPGTPAEAVRERPPAAIAPPALGYEYYWPWVTPPEGLTLGGYVQSQYMWSQSSQDQLAQGGTLLNKDRFLIRRARPSLIGEWEYVAFALELDANTTNGPQVDLRKAEASLQYRPDRSKPPVVMATLGQFDTPFGYELVESPRTRWFMERTTASQGWWPGEPDLGVRLAGALGFFRWTIAAVNGEPLGENSPFALQDPNASKDVVFRFGFDTLPREDLHLAGGVSSYKGTGFAPGTDGTTATLQYSDNLGNGSVSLSDLSATPAHAPVASQNFQRWAAGADLRAHYRWLAGVLKVYAEFMLGSNMDRNQFVANPILTGIDQRELGFYVAGLQEITPYGVVGLRYDYYDPNSNAFDKRFGQLVPFSEAIHTTALLAGVSIPARARLVLEYDIVRNGLARTAVGVPANLPSNTCTLRLQVQL